MEASGIVETKYAIEFMPSAALTFERNYPGATVYNQCANLLLARAIGQHMDGRELAPEQDFLGRRLPDMPAPGQVDFIYCGPPCQGFSGINRFPKADDIKNTLVTTSLSYVDFYRPRYFLLENVYGMVRFRLGGTQDSSAKIKDGIKMGVLKFIIRALTSM
ncbi:S-adenosyl-L-methionine-dependent methyltransferase, partial [Dimargaris cristalligena]